MRTTLGALLALVMAIASGPTLAQRYFGYWANSGAINENHDHTNITFVFQSFESPNTATNNIINELNIAKSKNLKAMVMVESFVFETQFSYGSSVPSKWNNFVNSLIAAGHLSYNNPSASTVIAFFVIDEPELHNLKDIGGQPHPAVSNAVATIKNHPATASFVTAATFSKKYMDAYNSVRLVDWAAMDDYSLNDASYISAFNTFQGVLRSGQRSIFMPQASYGGSMMTPYGDYNRPDPMYDYFAGNSKAILLMPFLWKHFATQGVSSIGELKDAYQAIGRSIKRQGPPPLRLSITCGGQPGAWQCSASASRGSPMYRFQWANSAGVTKIEST
jgi:hypothetical protein